MDEKLLVHVFKITFNTFELVLLHGKETKR